MSGNQFSSTAILPTPRAAVCLIAALLLSATVGCMNSPYRKIVEDINRPVTIRLADRIDTLTSQFNLALEHFKYTDALVNKTFDSDNAITDHDRERYEDAVDRCAWFEFELDRMSASLDDLIEIARPPTSTGALSAFESSAPTVYDSYRRSLRSAQVVMSAAVKRLQSARSNPTDRTEISFDLPTLKDAIEQINRNAATLVAALQSEHESRANDPVASVPEQ